MTNIEELLKRADERIMPGRRTACGRSDYFTPDEELIRDLAAALRELKEAKDHLERTLLQSTEAVAKERDQLRAELAKRQRPDAGCDYCQASIHDLATQLRKLEKERDQLRAENAKLRQAYHVKELARLHEENAELKSDFEWLVEHHRATEKAMHAAQEENARLKDEHVKLSADNARLRAAYTENTERLARAEEGWGVTTYELEEADKLLEEAETLLEACEKLLEACEAFLNLSRPWRGRGWDDEGTAG